MAVGILINYDIQFECVHYTNKCYKRITVTSYTCPNILNKIVENRAKKIEYANES